METDAESCVLWAAVREHKKAQHSGWKAADFSQLCEASNMKATWGIPDSKGWISTDFVLFLGWGQLLISSSVSINYIIVLGTWATPPLPPPSCPRLPPSPNQPGAPQDVEAHRSINQRMVMTSTFLRACNIAEGRSPVKETTVTDGKCGYDLSLWPGLRQFLNDWGTSEKGAGISCLFISHFLFFYIGFWWFPHWRQEGKHNEESLPDLSSFKASTWFKRKINKRYKNKESLGIFKEKVNMTLQQQSWVQCVSLSTLYFGAFNFDKRKNFDICSWINNKGVWWKNRGRGSRAKMNTMYCTVAKL